MRRALPLVVLALAFAGGLRTVISGADPPVRCRDDARRGGQDRRGLLGRGPQRGPAADPHHPARDRRPAGRDRPRAEARTCRHGPTGSRSGSATTVARRRRRRRRRPRPRRRRETADRDAHRDRDADGDRRRRRRRRPRPRNRRREPTETPAPTEPPVRADRDAGGAADGHGAALRGPLPAGAPARRGRHGHGPARVRHAAGAARRRQAAGRAPGRGLRVHLALPPRGA